MFDYLIVGAGFAGSVLAERLASQSDKKILIVDTKPHWRKCLRSLRCCRHSRPQVRSPHFSHQLPRGLRVPRTSPVAVLRAPCTSVWTVSSYPSHNLDTVNRLYGQISPHSRLRNSASVAEPKEYPHIRGWVVSNWEGTEVLPWLLQAMGHWPIWTRQVSHRPRSHPHKPWWAIFHRYVSGNAPVRIYPDVREDVVAPEHQNHAQHWLSGDCGVYRTRRWFTPVRLMNSSTVTESYLTARWSSARDAQHACASNSCSRELSQWASIHPRHRVQILDRTGACKTSIVYEYPRESEIHTTLYRVQRTLNSTRNTRRWLMAPGVNFVGRLTYKYYNMDQWWLRLWRCTAGYRLRQLGFARERRKTSACAEFCCKNFWGHKNPDSPKYERNSEQSVFNSYRHTNNLT